MARAMNVDQVIGQIEHWLSKLKQWLVTAGGFGLALLFAGSVARGLHVQQLSMLPSLGFQELAYACGCYWLIR